MQGTETHHEHIPAQDTPAMTGRLSFLSPLQQMMAALGIALLLYMIIGLLTDLVIRNYYGVSGGEMMKDMDSFLADHGQNLNLYRLMQILSTLTIFGFSALISSYLFTGRMLGIFDFSRKANFRSMIYVPVIILFAFPVITLIYFYLSQLPVPDALVQLEDSLETFTMALLSDADLKIFLVNFMMIAILPAICEELLFRGVFQRLLTKAFNNAHIGILITGLIFGLIHGQVFKFLPIAVLGILLGYLYWWTKNLWFPILAHFFHNGIQVILYFLVAKGWIDMDIESAEMLPPLQSAMFAVLFAGAMYLFYNANRNTVHESI